MTMDVATMFAVVIVLAGIGVIGNEVLQYLHRKVVFWEKQDPCRSGERVTAALEKPTSSTVKSSRNAYDRELGAMNSSRQSVFSGGSAEALLASMPSRLAGLVQRQAVTAPDRRALVSGGKTITIDSELLAGNRTRQGIAEIRRRGMAGDRVMIVNENSIAAVTFIFAASDLDAWASPINARMSAREIDACRTYSGCRDRRLYERGFSSPLPIMPRGRKPVRIAILFLARLPSAPSTSRTS